MEEGSAAPPDATARSPYRRSSDKPATDKETRPHSHRHYRRSGRRAARPSKPRPPPPPSQFVIEKQGRFEEDLWHTRVLTLDAPHHCLYLSKANKAEELHHRCMVRIDAVKLWPTFNSLRIGEVMDSAEAKRTACIKGLVGVKPSPFSFVTRFFGPSSNTIPSSSLIGRFVTSRRQRKEEQDEVTAAQTAAGKYRDPQLQPAPSDGGGGDDAGDWRDISEFDEFTAEVWMIRAMTAEDVRLLARALRRTVPDTGVLTGFHRTVEESKGQTDR